MNEDNAVFFGYVGITASVLVGLGAFLLHFFTGYLQGGEALLHISPTQLTWGHYLAISFLPLYIFGYWHFYQTLKSSSEALAVAVLILGISAFVVEGMWLSSRASFAVMHQTFQDQSVALDAQKILLDAYDRYSGSLATITTVLITLVSIAFAWAILQGGSMYPLWMVAFNPILLLGVIFGLTFLMRPTGVYIQMMNIHIAHFGMFLSSVLVLRVRYDNP